MNSRGRSAALRSAAHGKQSVRRPTLEGLNELCGLMTFENQSSTLLGSGLFWQPLPRVASDTTPPGAIQIGPLSGTVGELELKFFPRGEAGVEVQP